MFANSWVGISLLLTVHFVADFLFQTDWMALNKSKWHISLEGLKALTTHVAVYSFIIAMVFGMFQSNVLFFCWFGVTFVTHFITDAITSQWTSKLWFIPLIPRPEDEKDSFGYFTRFGAYDHYAYVKPTRHWFFVVIGLDQLIHGLTLLWTYKFLLNV